MSGIVYSTEKGRLCPDCGEPVDSCRCETHRKSQVLGSGKVRVRREVKKRGGKSVSVINGLAMNEQSLKECCREIKQKLGVGGAVKGGNIEIQGEHISYIIEHLKKKGIDAKKG